MLKQIYGRVALFAAIVMLIAIMATALNLWRQREDTLADATRSAGNIATILAEEVGHSVGAIDLVLVEVAERVQRRHIRTSDELRREFDTFPMHEFLTQRLARLPQADIISIADSQGNSVIGSRGWPTTAINGGDRDYIRHHMETPDPGVFVSAPAANRFNGAVTVFFSRRISSPDGAFLGVVWIGVRPEAFLQIRDSISSIPGQTLVLLRKDGTVFLREPDTESRAGSRIPLDSGWHDLIPKGGGVYRSPGVFDDVARGVSVRPLDRFPLVVNVATREDVALSGWRARAEFTLAGLIIALAVMALLIKQLMLQFRKAIRSDGLLRDREVRLTHIASHDGLTGLGNRTAFLEKVDSYFAEYQDTGATFAILLVDLDRFKHINDSYGHAIGDEALRIFAQRLTSACAAKDFAVRLGGDEFAIVRPIYADHTDAWIPFANRICAVAREPFQIEGHAISFSVSIGCARATTATGSAGDVMRNADLALYRAKTDGQDCFREFDPMMQQQSIAQLRLSVELRDALAAGALEVHYQPVFCARTQLCVGMEALARWRHPVRGMVSPGEFVPIAERFGLITQLGEFVLDRACRDAASWPAHIKVAVNVSAIQIGNETILPTVCATLSDTGLDPARLELEITESTIMHDPDRSLARLRELRALGISIALDDFGTGFSSLSYLSRFPLDKVKIDKSFVDRIGRDEGDTAIIAATTGIARALKITTTAEGVETAEQLALLRAAAVDQAQGYLLARPAPLEAWDFAEARFLPPHMKDELAA